MSGKRACPVVGIDKKTGQRRRDGCAPPGGHVGVSPITTVTTVAFSRSRSAP
ncbi:hypothetical protein ACQPZG_04725 (plasmid) [Streptomyces sp. CA-294286]|uniref:hypothetical protein n=1 Tax=Streptomyces sp. CA-294286 TaxID=3240070 RepID=UPI003D905A6E